MQIVPNVIDKENVLHVSVINFGEQHVIKFVEVVLEVLAISKMELALKNQNFVEMEQITEKVVIFLVKVKIVRIA